MKILSLSTLSAFSLALLCSSAGLVLQSCGSGTSNTSDPSSMLPPPGSVTWYKDIQPLVQKNCESCHTVGGIAPFPLSTYEQASPMHASLANATVARRMPPWMPSPDCQSFVGSRRLTQAQIDLFSAWDRDGAPLGDMKDAQTAPPPPAGLANPSLTLDWGSPYLPSTAKSDDYHCFIMDPQLAQNQDLVAYEFTPDQRQEVHHSLIYSAPRTAAQNLDNANAGIGWPCGGGSGVSGATLVATWVPGSPAISYPTGTGISIPSGNVLIAQMHYNGARI